MTKTWGGSWTGKKLQAFKKYVEAYLTIMHSQRRKRSWPKEIIYFDGFAGGANAKKKEEEDNQLFLDPKLFEGERIYTSTPEIVLSSEKSFDRYIFVDIDEERCEELRKIIAKKFAEKQNKCEVYCDDVNNVLTKLTAEWRKQEGLVSLVMLDPFGMQVKWKTIESLKELKVDLWMLFPSGVAVNRLLDRQGHIKYGETLEEFYGLSIEEIKKHFYSINEIKTIFGNSKERITKVEDSIQKSVELYKKRLNEIWEYVKMLELRNTKNLVIFHFLFASNNKTAAKIAGHIVGEKKSGK